MRRAALAAAGLALVLAGCPIPQPLPNYPAGTITPPRIVMDDIIGATDGNPMIFVPAGCRTTEPSYSLAASVSDTNTIEAIEARWFVNYDANLPANYNYLKPPSGSIPPNADTTDLIRPIPPLTFLPYRSPPSPAAVKVDPKLNVDPNPATGLWDQPGILRVVELVVSNGFDPSPITTASELPNRKPKQGFETQAFRWVFLSVSESAAAPCP